MITTDKNAPSKAGGALSTKPLPSCDRSSSTQLGSVRYHRLRKSIHLICFLIFIALPFSNVLRFDIPRQRFHFFGYELWISEFGILFFALMFLMFLIVVAAVFYGRIYCGYLCPQMIFSEASLALENRLRRIITRKTLRWKAKHRDRAVQGAFYGVVWICSAFLAFVYISYFVESI